MGLSGVVSWVGMEWCHGLIWSGLMGWSRAWLGNLRPTGRMRPPRSNHILTLFEEREYIRLGVLGPL